MIFRSKKEYVLEQALQFEPQAFYVEYGFKTRDFAEAELKKAVKQAHNEANDASVKEFLMNEYISNDFQALRESTYLDVYWADATSDAILANANKRKLDHILSTQQSSRGAPILKDRRLSETLNARNIIDLSNAGSSSQGNNR